MNPLFESFQRRQMGGGSLQDMLMQAAQQLVPPGMTPEQVVRQKIQNGELSQQKFDEYARMADQILGRTRR